MDPQNSQPVTPPTTLVTPTPLTPLSIPSTPNLPAIPFPEVPKPSSPLTKIAVFLLIISILSLAAYFIGTFVSGKKVISPTPTPTPLSSPSPVAILDLTANWKTYSNAELSFKYPDTWQMNGLTISSSSPGIKLSIVSSNSSLMNECMKETFSGIDGDVFVKAFSRVATGEMCSTNDSTPREIWIIPSSTKFTPGISFQYSSLESIQAEMVFDQILSTFKFLGASPTPSATPM